MKIINDRNQIEIRRRLRRESTYAERIFWNSVRGRGLDGLKIRRQVSIGCYVVDFYIPQTKLVIELDGDVHFTSEAIEYDKDRTRYLISQGYRVIRFTNDQIYESLDGVLEAIRTASGTPRSEHLT